MCWNKHEADERRLEGAVRNWATRSEEEGDKKGIVRRGGRCRKRDAYL